LFVKHTWKYIKKHIFVKGRKKQIVLMFQATQLTMRSFFLLVWPINLRFLPLQKVREALEQRFAPLVQYRPINYTINYLVK